MKNINLIKSSLLVIFLFVAFKKLSDIFYDFIVVKNLNSSELLLNIFVISGILVIISILIFTINKIIPKSKLISVGVLVLIFLACAFYLKYLYSIEVGSVLANAENDDLVEKYLKMISRKDMYFYGLLGVAYVLVYFFGINNTANLE